MKKAQALDPLSLIINADLAEQLVIAHSFDESIEQSRRTIEMDPNYAVAHYDLGGALMKKQSYPEAIKELESAVKLSGGSPICKSTLACAYARSGSKPQALEIQKEITLQSSVRSNAAEIALICTALHQNDEAMHWLESIP